jgi:hypothetical protein
MCGHLHERECGHDLWLEIVIYKNSTLSCGSHCRRPDPVGRGDADGGFLFPLPIGPLSATPRRKLIEDRRVAPPRCSRGPPFLFPRSRPPDGAVLVRLVKLAIVTPFPNFRAGSIVPVALFGKSRIDSTNEQERQNIEDTALSCFVRVDRCWILPPMRNRPNEANSGGSRLNIDRTKPIPAARGHMDG